MTWRPVQSMEEIEEFTQLLWDSHEAYSGETVESITENLFYRKTCEMWIYDGPTFKIPLSLAVVNDHVRVFTGIPSGDFTMNDQPRTSKEVIRKMRDYQDRYNVSKLVMNTLDDYGNEALNDYCMTKPSELMHEHESSKLKAGRYNKQVFKRDPSNKKDDEKFEGSKKRRIR